MSYTDTLITYDSAGGYGQVNTKQRYDAIATALAANANWTLVDTVDHVVAPTTNRSYVWKCAASGSGLPADFYVVFWLQFTTATGVWVAGTSPQIFLGEGYNTSTKVFSKYGVVPTTTAVTLNADLTMPATWTLNVARPTAAGSAPSYGQIDAPTSVTSLRVLIQVTNAHFSAFTSNVYGMYVGAFDSVMNSTDDPMPIILASAGAGGGNWVTGSSNMQAAASTRHPKLTPSTAYNNLGQYSYGTGHTVAALAMTNGALYANTASAGNGTIGDAANLQWGLFTAGVPVSPVGLTTAGSNGSGSTRGGYRGSLKGLVAAYTAAHTIGDTYTVGGVTYAALGLASAGPSIALDTSL